MLSEISEGFVINELTLLNGDDDKPESDNEKLFKATTQCVTQCK